MNFPSGEVMYSKKKKSAIPLVQIKFQSQRRISAQRRANATRQLGAARGDGDACVRDRDPSMETWLKIAPAPLGQRVCAASGDEEDSNSESSGDRTPSCKLEGPAAVAAAPPWLLT
jgi:hypothetical protein